MEEGAKGYCERNLTETLLFGLLLRISRYFIFSQIPYTFLQVHHIEPTGGKIISKDFSFASFIGEERFLLSVNNQRKQWTLRKAHNSFLTLTWEEVSSIHTRCARTKTRNIPNRAQQRQCCPFRVKTEFWNSEPNDPMAHQFCGWPRLDVRICHSNWVVLFSRRVEGKLSFTHLTTNRGASVRLARPDKNNLSRITKTFLDPRI